MEVNDSSLNDFCETPDAYRLRIKTEKGTQKLVAEKKGWAFFDFFAIWWNGRDQYKLANIVKELQNVDLGKSKAPIELQNKLQGKIDKYNTDKKLQGKDKLIFTPKKSDVNTVTVAQAVFGTPNASSVTQQPLPTLGQQTQVPTASVVHLQATAAQQQTPSALVSPVTATATSKLESAPLQASQPSKFDQMVQALFDHVKADSQQFIDNLEVGKDSYCAWINKAGNLCIQNVDDYENERKDNKIEIAINEKKAASIVHIHGIEPEDFLRSVFTLLRPAEAEKLFPPKYPPLDSDQMRKLDGYIKRVTLVEHRPLIFKDEESGKEYHIYKTAQGVLTVRDPQTDKTIGAKVSSFGDVVEFFEQGESKGTTKPDDFDRLFLNANKAFEKEFAERLKKIQDHVATNGPFKFKQSDKEFEVSIKGDRQILFFSQGLEMHGVKLDQGRMENYLCMPKHFDENGNIKNPLAAFQPHESPVFLNWFLLASKELERVTAPPPSASQAVEPPQFKEADLITLRAAFSPAAFDLQTLLRTLNEKGNRKDNPMVVIAGGKEYHVWPGAKGIGMGNGVETINIQIKGSAGRERLLEIGLWEDTGRPSLFWYQGKRTSSPPAEFQSALAAAQKQMNPEEQLEVEVDGEKYKVWFNPEFQSYNIQKAAQFKKDRKGMLKGSSQEDKIGVLVRDGKIVSVQAENMQLQTNRIPEKYVPRFLACFRKLLENSSSYTYTKSQYEGQAPIEIAVVRRGLSENPDFHLKSLTDKFDEALEFTSDSKVKVSFKQDDLSYALGIDAGGLTRDLFDDLCAAVTKNSHAKFDVLPSSLHLPRSRAEYQLGRSLPQLDHEEQAIFERLGKVKMHCYNSKAISGHWDNSTSTGRHFDDALFKAASALDSREIDTPFEELSLGTKLKMCKALTEAQTAAPQFERQNYLRMIELLAKANKGITADRETQFDVSKLTEQELEEACQIAYYGGTPPEGLFPEDLLTADLEPDMANIKSSPENKLKVLKALEATLFKSKSTTFKQFATQLAPIHAIAKGMKAHCSPGPLTGIEPSSEAEKQRLRKERTDEKWEAEFHGKDSVAISTKIQGSISREDIVRQIKVNVQGPAKAEIERKTGWLKEWILSKDTTDQEIRAFLKFVTGSSSLPKDKDITIESQAEGDALPVPKTHTCSFVIELAPVPSKYGEFNDHTSEGLIKSLRELALARPFDYQQA